MTALLLVGAGAVAARTALQLVDTPGVDRLLIADRDPARARRLARATGATPVAITDDWERSVDAVVCAVPAEPSVATARRAVAAGLAATIVDGDLTILDRDALDGEARARSVPVIVGAGFAPGLTDVLAVHAAAHLDAPDEVHVASAGTGGPACEDALRRARRAPVMELRDGAPVEVRPLGAELVWFPEPVGARECEGVATGLSLLHEALPAVGRVVVRAAAPSARSGRGPWRTRSPDLGEWGAARVEVWGWRDRARRAVVYGVVDRPTVAAGTVLALAGARAAGLLPALGVHSGATTGVHSLGAFVEPVPFLVELAARGVKAATFEGAAAPAVPSIDSGT